MAIGAEFGAYPDRRVSVDGAKVCSVGKTGAKLAFQGGGDPATGRHPVAERAQVAVYAGEQAGAELAEVAARAASSTGSKMAACFERRIERGGLTVAPVDRARDHGPGRGLIASSARAILA